MSRLSHKIGLVTAFVVAIAGSSLVTALLVREHVSQAQTAPAAAPAPTGDWIISAYFADPASPTNGFIILNNHNGKVSNCIANWQGKKEAKCYDWSGWVKLP